MQVRKSSLGVVWGAAATAGIALIGSIAVLYGQGFTFFTLQAGFTQRLFGTTKSFVRPKPQTGYLGGVAVLQNGNVIAAECETSATRLHIFDASVTNGN